MLAAGAAEALQRVAGDVVAAGDRDLLDRVGHVVDGDADEAFGRLRARSMPARSAISAQRASDGLGVDRLVAARAEHVREMLGADLAEHDVAVGDGERPAARGSRRGRAPRRRCPARPGSASPSKWQIEPPPAATVWISQHRRAHPHARDHRLAGALVAAGEMRDVGRGAAHVEADTRSKPASAGGLRHADDAARRAGQDRVLAAEGGGVGEPAVRLHEEQPAAVAAFRPADDLVDIAAQHRREIGVDHAGVAAADQLDQRLDLVAGRDLGEADLARQSPPAPPRARSSASRASARSRSRDSRRRRPPADRRARPQVERAQHLAVGA